MNYIARIKVESDDRPRRGDANGEGALAGAKQSDGLSRSQSKSPWNPSASILTARTVRRVRRGAVSIAESKPQIAKNGRAHRRFAICYVLLAMRRAAPDGRDVRSTWTYGTEQPANA